MMTRLVLIVALSIIALSFGASADDTLEARYKSQCLHDSGNPDDVISHGKQEECKEMEDELKAAAKDPCSAWSAYSACSKKCGSGIRTRTRTCSNSYLTWRSTEKSSCNTQACVKVCDDLVNLGCWGDRAARAISGGIRLTSKDPLTSCKAYAKEHGWDVFAVEWGSQCFTGPDAGEDYNKYGVSTSCHNGVGGWWSSNVYRIGCPVVANPNCREVRTSLGCYKDHWARAIAGGIRLTNTVDPVAACQGYALKNGWDTFAVEWGGQCFTSWAAHDTYDKYGHADNCKNGKGGWWSFNAYKVTKEC